MQLLLSSLCRSCVAPLLCLLFDLQSAVVMVNRIFQELALYVKASVSPSSSTCSPGQSLVIHQMLLLLSVLVCYDEYDSDRLDHSVEKAGDSAGDVGMANGHSSDVRAAIHEAERRHRLELFSSKRGEILVAILRRCAAGASKSAGGRSFKIAGEAGCASELVALATLRLFSLIMCGKSSRTTSTEHLHYLRPLLTDHRMFLGLFAFKTCPPLGSLVATLLREIVRSAQPAFVGAMRHSVLIDGTALVHVHSALFGGDKNTRVQSRFMLSLFMDDHSPALAHTTLFARCTCRSG